MEPPTSLPLAAGVLAIERITYACVWRWPESFRALCRRAPARALTEPITALEALFWLFKAPQVAVFGAWCWTYGQVTGQPDNWGAPSGALGLLLIAAGQALNVSVFLRLGRVGVFYGNRLGYSSPWRNGFPYSWLDHPQYVGAATSIWGLFLLLRHPHPDWFLLPLLETIYYAAGAWIERQPPHDAAEPPHAPAHSAWRPMPPEEESH